jgi:hypothetical protein
MYIHFNKVHMWLYVYVCLCLQGYGLKIICLKLLVYCLETDIAPDKKNISSLATVSGAGFGADQITFFFPLVK